MNAIKKRRCKSKYGDGMLSQEEVDAILDGVNKPQLRKGPFIHIAFWGMTGFAVLFFAAFIWQTKRINQAKKCIEASDFCNKKWVESWTNREKILWRKIQALQQSPDRISELEAIIESMVADKEHKRVTKEWGEQ
jgi:hypothetical protein